ncbi:aspartyl-phosphate phosphatase Spo0E family protein [Paenibacillus agilis]|uniref:Aspartyl-phosphate phosphatase Spo0E family protein n=1 Tax=Paenibacillus agilis TaxID=3020863 RepID=A0A559IKU4_9BACL|nr:aspartyl-phosphate phosphatase Spo0E family protein [Paenibacillus agilis]TVX88160.1 aspartyl-phosphate phosphatase Spo0E family protein [Paenibacillus agilis]
MTKIEIIEKKRVEMIKLISVCASLTDSRVILISQQLDELLNEYTYEQTQMSSHTILTTEVL